MMLRHYSDKPLKRKDIMSTVQTASTADFKPRGLWLSDGSAWEEWCLDEDFAPDRLVCVHEVEVDDGALIHIADAAALMAFDKEYASLPEWAGAYSMRHSYVDWSAVARRYAGIVIAPYIGSCRLDVAWYYPWDCASGCVWDKTAIRSVRIIEDRRASHDQA